MASGDDDRLRRTAINISGVYQCLQKGEKNELDMYMQKHEMSASSGQP